MIRANSYESFFIWAGGAHPGPNLGLHDQKSMLNLNLTAIWLGRVGLGSFEARTNISSSGDSSNFRLLASNSNSVQMFGSYRLSSELAILVRVASCNPFGSCHHPQYPYRTKKTLTPCSNVMLVVDPKESHVTQIYVESEYKVRSGSSPKTNVFWPSSQAHSWLQRWKMWKSGLK